MLRPQETSKRNSGFTTMFFVRIAAINLQNCTAMKQFLNQSEGVKKFCAQ